MEVLTLQDTQKLLKSIHSLHSLKNPQTFERDVLLLLEQLVPMGASCAVMHKKIDYADIVALLKQQESPEELCAHTAQEAIAIGLGKNVEIRSPEPDLERLFTADLFPLLERCVLDNPFIQHGPLLLTGAHKFSDFVTREVIHRKESLHELFAEIQFDDHMLLTFNTSEPDSALLSGDSSKTFGYFYFYRNWNEWTERDRLILNLIQPHVSQAYEAVRRFHQLYQQIDRLKEAFDSSGMVLLDEQGYIQQISAQAAYWLYNYCPTAYYSRQLPEPIHTWFIDRLTQLNRQINVLSPNLPPALPLCIKQHDRQLTIRLNGDLERKQYILLLTEEKTISLQSALEQLGLTKREAEILFWASQGQDNKAIAVQLKISVSTVRKHLENIYLKLQVNSRTEAVTRSLEQLGVTNQPYL